MLAANLHQTITESTPLANHPSLSSFDHCTFIWDGRLFHTVDKPMTKMILYIAIPDFHLGFIKQQKAAPSVLGPTNLGDGFIRWQDNT